MDRDERTQADAPGAPPGDEPQGAPDASPETAPPSEGWGADHGGDGAQGNGSHGGDPVIPLAPARAERPGSAFPVVALVVALAVSLLFNGLLAVRLEQRDERIAGLQREQADLAARLENLRQDVRGDDGDPVLDRVANAVERIRGIAFRRAVEPEILTPAGLRKRVVEEFERESPAEEMERSEALLRTLGLIGADVDLRRLLLDLYTEQIGGYYDHEAEKLVALGDVDAPTPLNRFVLAHEYTHAVTDQHFDLGRRDELIEAGKEDAATAFLALVEGDATLVSQIYTEEVLTAAEQQRLVAELSAIPRARYDAAPAFLRRALGFPYDEGLAFVTALHRQGGFELVDQAYKDPPVSTEQILHPARYTTNRDDPTAVTMPDVAKAAGGSWRQVESGDVGELDVVLVLDEELSGRVATAGAEGWDGGRYALLRDGDRWLVAISTVWDSASEARESSDAFERWLPLRYGNVGQAFSLPEGDTGRGWDGGDEGAGMVVRSGSKVVVLLGPDVQSVRAARNGFDL